MGQLYAHSPVCGLQDGSHLKHSCYSGQPVASPQNGDPTSWRRIVYGNQNNPVAGHTTPSQAVAGPQEAGRTGATASIAEAVQKDFSAAESSSAHHQPEPSAIQVADTKSTYIQGEQAAQAQRLSLRERNAPDAAADRRPKTQVCKDKMRLLMLPKGDSAMPAYMWMHAPGR